MVNHASAVYLKIEHRCETQILQTVNEKKAKTKGLQRRVSSTIRMSHN